MSDSQISQREIGRLHKLLAMARDKSATEHEAEAFLAKAQEIMAIHNLSMSQVESQGGQAGEDGKREKTKSVGRALYTYQRNLMQTIAESNFCLCSLIDIYLETLAEAHAAGRLRQKKRQGYTLIGRQSNIIASTTMFDYLNETMERLVPVASNAERLSKKAISWKEGCADRLRERVAQKAAELLAESRRRSDEENGRHRSGDGKALVLSLQDVTQSEADANNDVRYGYPPGTTAQRRLEWEARARDPAAIAERERQRAIYEAEQAETEAKMTPAQKKRRDEKGAADASRWWANYHRKQEQGRARLDQAAYGAGHATADNISLDHQIEEGRRAPALPSA